MPAAAGAARPARGGFAFMDNRPQAAMQRKMVAMANDGPLAVRQKARIGMANDSPRASQLKALAAGNGPGRVAQCKPAGTNLPGGPVVQRMSLNGVPVDTAVPYPNLNQAAILEHMAGEWDGEGGHAVTGGHLLDAMVAAWGGAVANSVPDNAAPAGVHFEESLPGNNITPHQHTFRLVNSVNGRAQISRSKQSTFWPRNWDAGALTATLNNSFRNGGANMWASKANMSYWYRWQTLGANTLFPIEKAAVATGTERNRMKAGRA